jgi:hypothetical protein
MRYLRMTVSRAIYRMVGGSKAGVAMIEYNGNQGRQELKSKRERLYKLFLKNPMETRLAVEIKVIDDQLVGRPEQTTSSKDSST